MNVKFAILSKTLLSALLLMGNAVLAQMKNDLNREKVKGNPKTVTEIEYTVVPGDKEPVKDAMKVKGVCKYNAQGNRIEFVTYSPEGTVQSRSVYSYDESSKLIDVKRYRADGGLNVRTTYKYDALGNQSEENNYDPSGTLFMTAKGKFDLRGNRITYDQFGPNGMIFLKTNTKYDKNSNEIEQREFDSHESLKFKTTYEYDNYDKNGNWQWRAMFKNDEPRSITERSFEY